MSRKLEVEVGNFRALRANTLVGFCTVYIPWLHLKIIDVSIHQKDRSRWVALPARPHVNKDGNARRDERTNKIIYSPVLEFCDRATRDAFGLKVIEALLKAFPHAFDEQRAA
jgi:hypothetical protein